MSRIVYVNGSYVPEEQGKISIFDRGFLFADGIYEVTAVVNGKLVDYAAHMERLERSLGEIRMEWPCSKDELRAMHMEMVNRNGLDEGWIYMQITRGSADRDFKFPKGVKPTLIAFTQAKKLVDSLDAVKGVSVITVPDIRWARRDIKTVMLLAPVLGKQAAYEAGAYRSLDGGRGESDRGNFIQRLYRQGRKGDYPGPVQQHFGGLHAARAVPPGRGKWCDD